MSIETVEEHIGNLTQTASSKEQRLSAVAELVKLVENGGLAFLGDYFIMDNMVGAAEFAGNPSSREGAMLLFAGLAKMESGVCMPLLLPRIETVLFPRFVDQVAAVRKAAIAAGNALMDKAPALAVPLRILPTLYAGFENTKWQVKTACLEMLAALPARAPFQMHTELPEIVPHLADLLVDTKTEVQKRTKKTLKIVFSIIGNADIESSFDALIAAMGDPTNVPACIDKLSSIVFVKTVNVATLSVLAPVLQRALAERSHQILRKASIITGNMAKLIDNAAEVERFLPMLLPGLEKVCEGGGDPELRFIAAKALITLYRVAELGTPPEHVAEALEYTDITVDVTHIGNRKDLLAQAERNAQLRDERVQKRKEEALAHHKITKKSLREKAPKEEILQLMHDVLSEFGVDLLKPDSEHNILNTPLFFARDLCCQLIDQREFDIDMWSENLLPLFQTSSLFNDVGAEQAVYKIRAKCDQRRRLLTTTKSECKQAVEVLCDIEFSLAYGTLILLNRAHMKLERGMRYGLCGANGAGKSTLMRAISEGKVEGFPARDVVRTVFVEHKLQSVALSRPLIEFFEAHFEEARLGKTAETEDEVDIVGTGGDPVSRQAMVDKLEEVGFTTEMLEAPVAALSGGWKMKLELARAMLLEADILLLDEPTNHLDKTNVAWLENYLTSWARMTVIVVSHDSGFLDTVCTHIIHYSNKQLTTYPGNLSAFVAKVPEAKSYYELTTEASMKFPQPYLLNGVKSKSNTPIIKLSNVSYTYPGASKPSLHDVSAKCSLTSRIAVLGANGAGKSTLIKVLTGETVPQTGSVWKHPELRIAYVAQHAFHHVEDHLQKSPSEYIMWRFQGDQDKELLQKQTRKLTEEEEQELQKPVQTVDKQGQPSMRQVKMLIGRHKLRKVYQYEVQWVGLSSRNNSWIDRDVLLEWGMGKLVQSYDDQEAAREGLSSYRSKPMTGSSVRTHFEDFSLDAEFSVHGKIGGLSGGQKVKVVLAAAMWNNPHMLVLDEPTNYLDRDALASLAEAIRSYEGGVLMISHNSEFTSSLCPEEWRVATGHVTFPTAEAEAEAAKDVAVPVVDSKKKMKKKKLTRNEQKAKEVRKRERHIRWLAGEKVSDEESD